MRLIEPDEYKDFLYDGPLTRLSTQVTKEYPIGDETDWLQHFRKDLEAGAFGRRE